MSEQFVVYIFREAFYTTLLVSSPILLLSLVVGLLISIVQAATSIQEFTFTFVPKVFVVAVVTILTLPWMIDLMVSFTTNLFHQIPAMAR